MRMTSRVRRDDRGAVLVIVAVFALVAVVFLAFVIDIGNQRQDRRQLTTATDAAALDIAQQWSDSSLEPLSGWSLISATPDPQWDCTPTLEDDDYRYLDENREGTSGHSCVATRKSGQLASVSVFAGGVTDYRFGPAVGINEGAVKSTTSVRIRSGIGGGLRPFAICAMDPDVEAWFTAGGTPSGQVLTLGGDKFLPPECGENNGNWGFVQFETQANGTPGIVEALREGTSDPTSSYDNGDGDWDEEKQVCIDDDADNTHYDDQDPVSCVFQVTGAGAWNNDGTNDALNKLKDAGTTFNLPVYADRVDLGGSETGFPIIGYAEVQLVDFDAQGADDNSLTLRFLRLTSGDCCEVNESNKALEICDVGTTGGAALASFAQACQTSDGVSGPAPIIPPAPNPCDVGSVTPSSQTVVVSGSDTTTPVTYVVTVTNPAECTDLAVRAQGAGPPRPGTVSEITPGVYDAVFPAGTKLQKNKTYAIEFVSRGGIVDDSASLETT